MVKFCYYYSRRVIFVDAVGWIVLCRLGCGWAVNWASHGRRPVDDVCRWLKVRSVPVAIAAAAMEKKIGGMKKLN